jgi:hypothetical protein
MQKLRKRDQPYVRDNSGAATAAATLTANLGTFIKMAVAAKGRNIFDGGPILNHGVIFLLSLGLPGGQTATSSDSSFGRQRRFNGDFVGQVLAIFAEYWL